MPDDDYSLRLIAALTDLWNAIRARHPEVPAVVLLPAPSLAKRMNVLGHFAPLRWRGPSSVRELLHEVVVVAEHLDRSAEDVLETLLHEAAHAVNHVRAVKDCSRSQYHNRSFRTTAESLGLTVEQIPNYGHARTSLPPAVSALYEPGLVVLREVLISRWRPNSVRGGVDTPTDDDQEGEDGQRSRHLKATCACGFVIRASKKTLTGTAITCGTCGEPFRTADS